MSIVLSFDLGTTAFKAAVVDDAGRMLALARLATPIDQPHEGWRQISHDRFTQTLRQLTAMLVAQDAAAMRQVAALSFATQSNSVLLLDERDQALTPIALWSDRRADECMGQVQEWWRDTGSYEQTGITRAGRGIAVAKLLWWQRHEPDLWRRVARVRLIGDEFVAWLTGVNVTEAGAAGLTGMLDIHSLRWRRGAMEALGIKPDWLPTPERAGARVGPLRPLLARELGVPESCHVVLGCLDQYAGAIGAGNLTLGDCSETTGTVLSTVRLADHFDSSLRERQVIQGPTWRPGLYWRMRVGSISANLLEAMHRSEPDAPSYEALIDEARHAPPRVDKLQLDDDASTRQARPIFSNQTAQHQRGHRVQAILEAVARALRQQVADVNPESPRQIRSVGGAARSEYWLQIKADTLTIPFEAMDCPEPTCLGAAVLALASDLGIPISELAPRLVRCRQRFEPRPPGL